MQPSQTEQEPSSADATHGATAPAPSATDDPARAKIVAACGACHSAPEPGDFTDRTWGRAIAYMYRIQAEFFADEAPLPPIEEVHAYYRRNSAKRVAPPTLYPAQEGLNFKWTHQEIGDGPSMIASLKDGYGVDVLSGQIFGLNGPGVAPSIQSRGRHPVHALKTDLDQNGEAEWVIAELGTFVAKDTTIGGVSLTIGPTRTPLLKNVGRISDVVAGDLNGDGRVDLVIAEFGWQKSGGLHVLLQKKTPLTFTRETLSTDAGVVSIALGDMDGDTRLDIVSLVSQHHERIDVWKNEETGFKRTTIFRASTPLWGALGLMLFDLDGDGRRDVIHWNGDNLDAPKLAAFQGVHWIQNRPHKYVSAQLAQLPGVHDVTVADLDGDGAHDLVAVANLPPRIHETLWPSTKTSPTRVPVESVLFLKQTSPGEFQPRSLLRDQACFSAVAATDWDTDGDMDLILGSFGVGWTLLGHHGDAGVGSVDGAACRSGGLFWLENTQTDPTAPPTGQAKQSERIAALRTITQNDPQDSLNRVNLADALMKTQRFREAEPILRAAIRLDPDEKAAYINLALSLALLGRLGEAEEVCRQVIKRHPDFGDGYSQLSTILSQQNRSADALVAAKRAVHLTPDNVDYRLNLGVGFAQLGKLERAEAEFRAVLKQAPNHPRAINHLERIRRGRTHRAKPAN